MFCNYCGAKNPDGANFCSKCGSRLAVMEETAPAQNTPMQSSPMQGAPANEKTERLITLTRMKNFQGGPSKAKIYIDDQVVSEVANGKTVQFPLDTKSHTIRVKLTFVLPIESETLIIPADTKDHNYKVFLQNGPLRNYYRLEEV